MDPEVETDKENERDVFLMSAVACGDAAALAELVDRHKDAVYGTVSKMLGGHGDIEDISQQVFIRVWKSAKSYEPTAKFTTWLFTITRNLVFNETRRLGRKKTVSHDEMEEEFGVETVDQAALSPHDSLLEKELTRAVDRAIEGLSEKARMAVILRRYQDMPYEEIAGVLKVSVSAAKSLLFRARTQLREALQEYLNQ